MDFPEMEHLKWKQYYIYTVEFFFSYFSILTILQQFFLLDSVTDIINLNFYDCTTRGLYAATTTSLHFFPANNSIIPFPVIFNYIESGTNLIIKYSFSVKKIILSQME